MAKIFLQTSQLTLSGAWREMGQDHAPFCPSLLQSRKEPSEPFFYFVPLDRENQTPKGR